MIVYRLKINSIYLFELHKFKKQYNCYKYLMILYFLIYNIYNID